MDDLLFIEYVVPVPLSSPDDDGRGKQSHQPLSCFLHRLPQFSRHSQHVLRMVEAKAMIRAGTVNTSCAGWIKGNDKSRHSQHALCDVEAKAMIKAGSQHILCRVETKAMIKAGSQRPAQGGNKGDDKSRKSQHVLRRVEAKAIIRASTVKTSCVE